MLEPYQRQQQAFALHLRDPQHHPRPPDLDDRRVAVYRELFYNNVASLLAANFPVMDLVLAAAAWDGLRRAFFAAHRCQTPLFTEFGREFVRYLEQRDGDPGWWQELAHYEFSETALRFADTDLSTVACDPDGDLRVAPPVLSPLAWPLLYHYPVHRIRPDFVPDAPADTPTCLIVVRNRADDVSFLETTPLTLRMIELIGEQPHANGDAVVGQVAALFPPDSQPAARAGAWHSLLHLRDKHVILGTAVASTSR